MLVIYTFNSEKFRKNNMLKAGNKELLFCNKSHNEYSEIYFRLEKLAMDEEEHHYVCNNLEIFDIIEKLAYVNMDNRFQSCMLKIHHNSRVIFGNKWSLFPGTDSVSLSKAIGHIKKYWRE